MSDNPEMPEGEPKYEPSEEEIKDAESRMTDEEKEMSEKRELQPNPESFEMLALECEQVRTLAEAYSQKTREPVVVLCNGSAGTIYHIGIDSVSTQFNRQMADRVEEGQDRESFIRSQREEFTKDWQKNLQETRESWPKDLPLTKSRKVALIKTAKEWMDVGRLDFLAITEIDIRMSSTQGVQEEKSEQVSKALSLVKDKCLTIFLDWSDFGRRFPDSAIGMNYGFQFSNENKNQLSFENEWAYGREENIEVNNPQELSQQILGRIKTEGRNLFFSPMHTPRAEDKRDSNGVRNEKEERQFEIWKSKVAWLRHWPAGADFVRAKRIKGEPEGVDVRFGTIDEMGEVRLNLFAEETDDTESRIRKYNQAMRNAVRSIRKLQVNENGNNYFQRQKKYRI